MHPHLFYHKEENLMIQAYSKNVTVATNTGVPFNSTSLIKGCTSTKTGVSTITLNKAGVYMLEFDAAVAGTVGGTISVQLSKNGTLMPEAFTAETAADTTDLHSISFQTLVQVNHDNSCRCSDSGTVVEIINTGVPALYTHANIVITKIC